MILRYTLALLLFCLVMACSQGEPPAAQWKLAVQGVYSAALSSDAKNVIVGSVHHGGSYWQLSPLERIYDWNHEARKKTGILAAAISEDGSHAATAEHRKIVLWKTQTGEAFWLWEAPADIQALELDSSGSMALLGMDNYEAALFDIRNGGIIRRLNHDGIVQAVDMTPNLQWAITGGDDSRVKVWSLRDGKLKYSWELNNQIKTVAINALGTLAFASSHRGQTRVWDLTTGEVIASLPNLSGHYQAARFNKTNDELLTGTSSGKVQVWKIPSGEQIKSYRMSPRNPWVAQNTQTLSVAFFDRGYRAVGANGIVYSFE